MTSGHIESSVGEEEGGERGEGGEETGEERGGGGEGPGKLSILLDTLPLLLEKPKINKTVLERVYNFNFEQYSPPPPKNMKINIITYFILEFKGTIQLIFLYYLKVKKK